MTVTNYTRDKFVSQDLSQLTANNASAVAPDFPEYKTWLHSFILNNILKLPLKNDAAALAFVLIRRAGGAIEDYEEARDLLSSYVSDIELRVYFQCLRRFESAISQTYQAFELSTKAIGRTLFSHGDGSTYQRLNQLYNDSKHANPMTLPPGHLHAVWITNDGLNSINSKLTFSELRDLIQEIGRIAHKVATATVPTPPPSTSPNTVTPVSGS